LQKIGKHGYTQAATSDDFCRETYKIKFGASVGGGGVKENRERKEGGWGRDKKRDQKIGSKTRTLILMYQPIATIL
jgi:hypothetical protein